MIDLAQLLKIKYPNIDLRSDVVLQDDGQGSYIKTWNLEDKKPSQEDLLKWATDLQDQVVFEQNKKTNQPIYDQLNGLDLSSIRALREKDDEKLTEIEAQAAALRDQLLPVE